MSTKHLSAKSVLMDNADKNKISGIALTSNLFGSKKNNIVDFDSLKVPKGKIGLLMNHDPDKIIGWVRLEKSDNKVIVVGGKLSENTTLYSDIKANFENKVPFKFSVGLSVKDYVFTENGEVNGRNVKNTTSYVGTEVTELSLTVVPADRNTHAEVLNQELQSMKEEDETQVKLQAVEIKKLTAENDALLAENKVISKAFKQRQLTEIANKLSLNDKQVDTLNNVSISDLTLFLGVLPDNISTNTNDLQYLLEQDSNIGDTNSSKLMSIEDHLMKDTAELMLKRPELTLSQAENIVLKMEKYNA